MCLVDFISFHPDNHGGKLGLLCPFLKGGNGSPKSLDDLVRVGQ